MEATTVVDIETLKWTHYLYFGAGITVLILGAIGVVMVVLGVLQLKFLKPYKNRYPFEEFKNFDEFTKKKPAKPGVTSSSQEDPQEALRKKEKRAKNEPILTWDNATDQMNSLSKQEYKILQECANQIKDATTAANSDSSMILDSDELVDEIESEKIPTF